MQVDVTVIAGTRPEAIKLAPVVHAMRETGLGVQLLATGQHRELLARALADFDLTADDDLDVMNDEQSLSELTARLMSLLPPALAAAAPRLVMVQGDTTTAFAGALAAFYAGLPCAHVEAGLRSGDRAAPWPEELNRQLADRLCTRHYAPTTRARDNLLRENIDPSSIVVTGQTGVDAALWTSGRLGETTPAELAALDIKPGRRLVYATGHRREALLSGGLAGVAEALKQSAQEFPDLVVVFAAHPNPAARRQVAGLQGLERVHLVEPLSYPASVWMLRRATVIVSDSGGIQEEAPSFGKPVLVTREVTERPEGVEAGFLKLVGTRTESILDALRETLRHPPALDGKPNPYGDGRAAMRIAEDVKALSQ